MSPAAADLLRMLTYEYPHREVYRARNGSGWYVTYGGGKVDTEAVCELVTGGHIRSVYSNCPDDSYHVGRTLDIQKTLEARKGRPRSHWPKVYMEDSKP